MDKTTIYEALFEKSSVTLFFISRDDECTERLMQTNSLTPKSKKNVKPEENVKVMNKLREAFQAASCKCSDNDDAYESGTEETSDFGLIFASDISSGSDEGDDEEEVDAEEDAEKVSRDTIENRDDGDDENDITEEGCDDKTTLPSESSSEATNDDDEETAKKCSRGEETSSQMSGLYDAMVVHADLNATEFFARNGFSGDPLLNKQWASLAGEYVNCLLMTYFPPLSFGSPTTSSSKVIESIDKSIDKWLVATGDVHQMQYTLCKRLRAEVVRLQNQLLSQDSLVQVLKREVVKQAHTIEELRGRLQKCAGDVDAGAFDSDTTFAFTLLPPPLDPESQLSISFNGVSFRDYTGDEDAPSLSSP
ncbi:hypothetical protein TcWFU_001732 [Taenia crassiceps]|uniref:Uncharacterized protein n=1 Tax=Taenia crassiceps TaxID=6207 RepID=A0ABR4Q3G0_9CEST